MKYTVMYMNMVYYICKYGTPIPSLWFTDPEVAEDMCRVLNGS